MDNDTMNKLKTYADLYDRLESLKWELLDSREDGVQPALARIHGVTRQTVNKWANRRTASAQKGAARLAM